MSDHPGDRGGGGWGGGGGGAYLEKGSVKDQQMISFKSSKILIRIEVNIQRTVNCLFTQFAAFVTARS